MPLLGGHLGKDGLAAAKELPALGSVRVVQPGLLLQNLGLDLRTPANLASWAPPRSGYIHTGQQEALTARTSNACRLSSTDRGSGFGVDLSNTPSFTKRSRYRCRSASCSTLK